MRKIVAATGDQPAAHPSERHPMQSAALMDVLERANARAQRRFHDMLAAHTFAEPTSRHTRLYLQAERLIDALMTEAAWEKSKAKMDALQTADLAELELRAVWGDR